MSNNITIKSNLEVTAIEKVYTDKVSGDSYPYFDYYVNIEGVSVKLSPSKNDFTAKQLLKKYFNNLR